MYETVVWITSYSYLTTHFYLLQLLYLLKFKIKMFIVDTYKLIEISQKS